MRAVMVHGCGQGQPFEHSAAPRKLAILPEVSDYEDGRAFFHTLNNPRGVGSVRGPNQQVKVLRHENVAEDSKAQAAAQFVERFHEVEPKTVGIEKRRAPVGAGSKGMQVIEPVIMALARHPSIL